MIKKGITDSSIINNSDETLDRSLRPKTFNEMIGRDVEKRSLKIMIESAKKRSKPIDHILFHGPPGLGKTSFAHVIANEMGVPIHITNGSVMDKAGDIAAILTSLEKHSILFIDEIHRLKLQIEEILYPAMEDSVLDIVIGKGPNARTLRLELPEFTIIGATTKLSMLSGPLRDRFGMSFRLDFYSNEELQELIIQKAKMLNAKIDNIAALEIARRARMTARIAIRILKRVRDMAIVENQINIDVNLVKKTLELLDIDENGFDIMDRNLIKVILKHFDNKPVGLSTLAASLSEEEDTIESVYEPYLIKKGFLKRTSKGRVLTQLAIDYYNDLLLK